MIECQVPPNYVQQHIFPYQNSVSKCNQPENLDTLDQKLMEVQERIQRSEKKRQWANHSKSMYSRRHHQLIESRKRDLQEKERSEQASRLAKFLEMHDLQNVKAKEKEKLLQKVSKQIHEVLSEKQALVEKRREQLLKDQKLKQSEIYKRQVKRAKSSRHCRDLLNEHRQERWEYKTLRKQDHQENWERVKMLDDLRKQKLIEKIIQKKLRTKSSAQVTDT